MYSTPLNVTCPTLQCRIRSMGKTRKRGFKTKTPALEEVVSAIRELVAPTYAEHGEHDENGYQVFTPDFIVEGMIRAIGVDKVADPSVTILEPASGDGAFTGRILALRLEKLLGNEDCYRSESLRALSTIYSIEMDGDLIIRQRNNIFTVFAGYARNAGLEGDAEYLMLAKRIIAWNFFWGKTAVEDPHSLFLVPSVAYPMPEEAEGSRNPLRFPVWSIHEDLSYDVREEDVDL